MLWSLRLYLLEVQSIAIFLWERTFPLMWVGATTPSPIPIKSHIAYTIRGLKMWWKESRISIESVSLLPTQRSSMRIENVIKESRIWILRMIIPMIHIWMLECHCHGSWCSQCEMVLAMVLRRRFNQWVIPIFIFYVLRCPNPLT